VPGQRTPGGLFLVEGYFLSAEKGEGFCPGSFYLSEEAGTIRNLREEKEEGFRS
jgi:hypothetical protein